VLSLLPFAAGAFCLGRVDLRIASVAIIAALLLGLWLIADGELSRTDGAALVLAWIDGTAILWATARALLRAEGSKTQLLALPGTLTFVAIVLCCRAANSLEVKVSCSSSPTRSSTGSSSSADEAHPQRHFP
jgi:hypothetical protein